MPPEPSPPSLPSLIEDLLNPSITTAELCQLHHLTLDQLDDLLTSPEFENARARFTRANATRRALLEDEAQTLATARLTDLLRDRPETPAHAETVRKAATTLRISSCASPAPGGGGAEQREAEGVPLRVPRVAQPTADNPCAESSIGVQHHNPPSHTQHTGCPSPTEHPVPPKSSCASPAPGGGGAEQSEAEGASCPSPRPVGRWSAKGGSEGSSLDSPGHLGNAPTKPAEGAPPNPQSLIPNASTTPSPSNPHPSQPVPTTPGTTKESLPEGVSDMNTKAAAAIFTIALGSGIIGAAWYMAQPRTADEAASTPPPAPERDRARADMFAIPSTPSPAKVFFESAAGTPIPASAQRDVRGMIGMMAALIERMDEFDVNGDGRLDDLERIAMGFKLREEFLAEHDLDGDGDMSRDEWRAFQQAMFEQSAKGQALMAQFDLDGDGVLNEEEQAAFDEHLRQQEEQRRAEDRARMDKNNDGQISDDERRDARRQEREFWRNQMRTAENNFDYDGDGELNIEETGDAWEAWVEYQELDDFISRFDANGDRNMGPADYDAFLSAYDRQSPEADVNNDGEVTVSDINAFRDMVLRSRSMN